MGHAFGLEHTFFETASPSSLFCPHIPKYSTLSFMDYQQFINGTPKNFLFYYPWSKSNYY
jgi:hypothetical protein